MITKKENIRFENKKFSMIIGGFAGIGKTTLALSSPKPILIDLDNQGIGRVMPKYRKDVMTVSSYEELIDDLQSDAMNDYETIVIDTGSKMLELLKVACIKENPQNGQRDGTLSIKGYGAVSRKFKHVIGLCNQLDKNVIIIFHAKEEKDGDVTKLRIAVEGSTKETIWQDVDFGGFMEMSGKDREISFKSCEKFFAKGIFGINGTYKLKDLEDDKNENDFISKMFALALKNANVDAEKMQEEQDDYNGIMENVRTLLSQDVKTVEEINEIKKVIEDSEHALTSERESKILLHELATKLGFVFDKVAKCYVSPTE